jgi:hypothetical protein
VQGHWVNDAPYYRCRFPAEYALAYHVEHPLSVYLREAVIIGEVDGWPASSPRTAWARPSALLWTPSLYTSRAALTRKRRQPRSPSATRS